jgi:molecular chaperone Hsp33
MTNFQIPTYTQRFIFDDSDTRGELVALERSYAEVLAKHPYPEPVAQLLGELMAAAALLVGTLKFDGLLILQARSEGPIPMLMIECSSDRDIRGLARYESRSDRPRRDPGRPDAQRRSGPDHRPANWPALSGHRRSRWRNLSDCCHQYFVMSEQVGTRFWLNADGRRARGLLLQQLPADA